VEATYDRFLLVDATGNVFKNEMEEGGEEEMEEGMGEEVVEEVVVERGRRW